MIRRLSVGAPVDAGRADVNTALVTLPLSFAQEGAAGEVRWSHGGAGWADAAAEALRHGARGILVLSPTPTDVGHLAQLSRETGAPVVLDMAWTHNPAVQSSQTEFRAVDSEDTLVESRVHGGVDSSLVQLLLDQLALVRRSFGPVVSVVPVRCTGRGYDVLAHFSSGARGAFAGLLSNALPPTARVRVIRPDRIVELDVPAAATAAPGRVLVRDHQRACVMATAYESAHRVAWRRLHGLVTSGAPCDDLDEFAADLRLARSLADDRAADDPHQHAATRGGVVRRGPHTGPQL